MGNITGECFGCNVLLTSPFANSSLQITTTKAFQQTAYPLARYVMSSLILTRGRLMLMIFGAFKYAAYVPGNLGLHFHTMYFVFCKC
jgi:hypothetical protein